MGLVHGQGVILQCTGQGVLVCVIGAVLPSHGVILREALIFVLGTREEDVLANSGCRNKIPPPGWLKQKCIFSRSRGWKHKSKRRTGCVSSPPLSLSCRWPPLSWPLPGAGSRGVPLGVQVSSSYRFPVRLDWGEP